METGEYQYNDNVIMSDIGIIEDNLSIRLAFVPGRAHPAHL